MGMYNKEEKQQPSEIKLLPNKSEGQADTEIGNKELNRSFLNEFNAADSSLIVVDSPLMTMYSTLIRKNKNNTFKNLKRKLYAEESTRKKTPVKTNENIIYHENDVQNKLSTFFTKTQIQYFLQPQKRIQKWENEDIIGAITLRSISPKINTRISLSWLVQFQTKKSICLSTLRTWALNFHIEPGVLYGVLRIMKAKDQ
ncbi:hypothetical protein QTP88_016949 [Uroleucon formosanum]